MLRTLRVVLDMATVSDVKRSDLHVPSLYEFYEHQRMIICTMKRGSPYKKRHISSVIIFDLLFSVEMFRTTESTGIYSDTS
jgi:hypothetical protein